MTLVEHLTELRRRVVISILFVAAGTAVGFYFALDILKILIAPLRAQTGKGLIYTGLGDAFFVQLKVALVFGIVVAMPMIVFQGWRFISPGLTPHERRLARPWVPFSLAFFALGVAVAYVVLPYAVQFLVSFSAKDIIEPFISASEYFGLISTMFLAFGLVMQFPIVVVLLAEAGILTSSRLRSSRRYVLLGIAIFAAIATPGGDLVSPFALGAVMYGLYELTILLVRWRGH